MSGDAYPELGARALCGIEDVTAYAPGYEVDDRTDELLLRLIDSESRTFHKRTGREIVAITPPVNVRRFDLGAWHVRQRKVLLGDLASAPTTVRIYDHDQSTLLQTLAAADYVTLPRVRQEWEPIRALTFPYGTPDPAELAPARVLEVTGTWGFPLIPEDVREAVAGMVLFRYARDAASAGTQLAESLAQVDVGALFANAQRVLRSHSSGPFA